MAVCITAVRSNYFHVKDESQFRSMMKRAYGADEDLILMERKDQDGRTMFSFGCRGRIGGLHSDAPEEADEYEYDYDRFIDTLSSCVAEDDAVIIFRSGFE